MNELFGKSFEALRLHREDDLLWVTLDNPDKANALSPRMIDEILELYEMDLRREGLRALLLSGAGKHFSAGADLAHLKAMQQGGAEDDRRDSERLRRLFASILYQDVLTIALVHGSCVAGGCGLATAHDYVIAAEDARFMYSEVRIGFVAALVATFLPLRVKGRDLRELLLDPQFLGAEKALEIGLINRVVPSRELRSAGQEMVEGILTRGSSESIARTKQLLREAVGLDLESALRRAAEINAASRSTADCKHGVATFLATKKPPRWR